MSRTCQVCGTPSQYPSHIRRSIVTYIEPGGKMVRRERWGCKQCRDKLLVMSEAGK